MNSVKYNGIDQQSPPPGIVYELLNSYLHHPGKLIRSNLTIKLSGLLGLPKDKVHAICWASESIHNASLIHDDVVDQAFIRRDQPTLNSTISNSKAVLAGDYLLACVIAELVKLNQFAILKTLSESLEEIVEGEFLQDSLKSKPSPTVDDLIQVSSKKTGALISWCCHSVALTAGLGQESQDLCRELGLKLGLAFQMMDDNIDYTPDSGKEFAKDLKEGLLNFTTLNLLKLHPETFYSIHQLRGTQFSKVPWSDTQLAEAVTLTKIQADLIFSEIFLLIDELVSLNSLDHNSQEYTDLIQFLRNVQGRRK